MMSTGVSTHQLCVFSDPLLPTHRCWVAFECSVPRGGESVALFLSLLHQLTLKWGPLSVREVPPSVSALPLIKAAVLCVVN